jgi:hypothetical protein
MRSSLFKKALGVAALFIAGSSMAAGPLDGIYQFGEYEDWWSIHQSGNHVVVGRFFNSNGGFSTTFNDGRTYKADKAGIWYLLGGDVDANGTSVTVSGESRAGACLVTYRFEFGAPQLWVQWASQTTTPAGKSQGIDCEADHTAGTVNGTWWKIRKIY